MLNDFSCRGRALFTPDIRSLTFIHLMNEKVVLTLSSPFYVNAGGLAEWVGAMYYPETGRHYLRWRVVGRAAEPHDLRVRAREAGSHDWLSTIIKFQVNKIRTFYALYQY